MSKNLKAPILKGQEIGKVQFIKDGKVIVESPLVSQTEIKEAGWWTLFKRTAGMFTKTE